MKTIAVYSCITGEYEKPKGNQNFEGADFYLFIDQDNLLTKWHKKKAANLFTDPRRNARYHKLLSHEMFPEYDFTVWIDGSIILKIPADKLVEEMGNADVLVLKHPARNCAYQEAVECLRLCLDFPANLHGAIAFLRSEQYPEENGLAETKIIVRRNNETVKKMNELWFYKVTTGTLRDQVSFNYAAWKTNAKIKYMPPWTENPWINYVDHNRIPYESSL